MEFNKLFPLEACGKCKRDNYCIYPCEDLYNELKILNSINSQSYNQPVARVLGDDIYDKSELSLDGSNNDKNKIYNENYVDIEDILNFPIESPEFLAVVNGLVDVKKIISGESLLIILSDINDKYCEDNNLCKVCRSELEEVSESRGEHFGRNSYEKMVICPKCGG